MEFSDEGPNMLCFSNRIELPHGHSHYLGFLIPKDFLRFWIKGFDKARAINGDDRFWRTGNELPLEFLFVSEAFNEYCALYRSYYRLREHIHDRLILWGK